MFRPFLSLPVLHQALIGYGIAVNLLTFFYFGMDKLKARFHDERVSEKMLWFLSAIGGSAGALLGMKYFRHKTRKMSFQTGIAVILAVQIALVVWGVML